MNEQPLSTFLKTFPHARYCAEWRLLTWHPRGLFDDALADMVLAALAPRTGESQIPGSDGSRSAKLKNDSRLEVQMT
jgi:hypothetical protein